MKLKSFIYLILYYSGFNYVYSLFLNKKIFVIMYHSIGSSKNSESLRGNLYHHVTVDKEDFDSQMKYLKKRGHTFISFDDIRTLDLSKISKPTVIYFDDGFKDVLLNAVPVLEKYDIPATVFLPTGVMDRTDMLWTIVYREILTKQNVPLHEQNMRIHEIKTQTEQKRIDMMKKYNLSDYSYLFDIFLSWDEIRGMLAKNISFGSHSVTHPRLTECSKEVLQHEVIYSKQRIEKEIGRTIHSFSLPYGRGDNELVELLGKLGYKFVVSKGKGLNVISDTLKDVVFLRNISPKPNESLMLFKLKLYALNLKQ